MDTVLGLSIAPTTVGWVLLDGSHPETKVLARGQFGVGPRHRGLDAADTATRAESVIRLQAMVEDRGRSLHGIGVTWSADATAQAAVLLESLTAAGCDNVVTVPYPRTAAVSSGQVFGQAEVQLASARRAATAVAAGVQFAARQPEHPLVSPGTSRPRRFSYVGAVAMLIGGVLTFVVSLSTALSLQLVPVKDRHPAAQVASAASIPPIPRAATPAAAPLPAEPPPPAEAPPPEEAPSPPEEVPEPATETPEASSSPGEPPPAASAAMAPASSGPRSLLSRVLGHLPRLRGH